MAYSEITSAEIQVSKALRKELMLKIKNNFDAHETLLTSLSVGSGPAVVFNEEIYNISSTMTLTGIAYWKAHASVNITKAEIQIFTKEGITSGIVEYDLKKSSTLGGTYATILTTKPAINYASAVDYESNDGVLNAGQAVAQDHILRLDITSVPAGKVITKIRVRVYGVIS